MRVSSPGQSDAITLPSLFAEGRSVRQSSLDSDVPVIEEVGGQRWSTDVLWSEVARTIDALSASGVVAGDRVLVQAEKSVGVVLVYLACVHVGAVFLPLNAAYTDAEAQWMVDDATPSLVLRDPSRTVLTGPHRSLTIDANGAGSFADLVAAADAGTGSELVFGPTPRQPDEVTALLYTSGTTGRPKGAMLTQHNLASNAAALRSAWGFTPNDRLLHILPVFHAHGLFVGCNVSFATGSSILWLAKFDPDAVFANLPKVSVLMGVPTHYTRLLADERLTLDAVLSMRLFVSGSAPLLASTHEEFEERTGQRILERYGMTETVMLTSNPLRGERRAGTVGPAIEGVSVRIVDDHGASVPDGSVGSVEVSGPNVFSGYWNRADLAATEFTADGFFRTGDVGLLEDGGYLRLIGRAKDLVITGGLNVYPIEVEETLDALDGVHESAVIGVPDPDFGEAVVAVIVAEPGAVLDGEAIRSAARERLASFKVPKRVHIVDVLPRNAMGKVEKAKLRSTYSA